MEEARDKVELMPRNEPYAKTKEFMSEKDLALSLIEMYDHLDE
jgi:hypothetical protein